MTKVEKQVETIVEYFINEYDIEMLSIKHVGKNRQFVSLKKAIAILDTNLDAELIEPIKKHGRNMYKITHMNGGSFIVGLDKMNAVLDANGEILRALNAAIDNGDTLNSKVRREGVA